MEYFYPEGQWIVALYFALVGSALCLVYDVFRIKREFFGSSRFVLFLDDLLYTFICTVCVILGILKINSGSVRWYETFFALLGFVLYRITLSRIVTGFFFFLSRIIKKMLSATLCVFVKIVRPLLKPVRKFYTFINERKNVCVQQIILFNYKTAFLRKMRKVSLKTGDI